MSQDNLLYSALKDLLTQIKTAPISVEQWIDIKEAEQALTHYDTVQGEDELIRNARAYAAVHYNGHEGMAMAFYDGLKYQSPKPSTIQQGEYEEEEYALKYSLHDINKSYNQGVGDALMRMDEPNIEEYLLRNCIYLALIGVTGEDGYSIPSAVRQQIEDKIIRRYQTKSPKPSTIQGEGEM